MGKFRLCKNDKKSIFRNHNVLDFNHQSINPHKYHTYPRQINHRSNEEEANAIHKLCNNLSKFFKKISFNCKCIDNQSASVLNDNSASASQNRVKRLTKVSIRYSPIQSKIETWDCLNFCPADSGGSKRNAITTDTATNTSNSIIVKCGQHLIGAIYGRNIEIQNDLDRPGSVICSKSSLDQKSKLSSARPLTANGIQCLFRQKLKGRQSKNHLALRHSISQVDAIALERNRNKVAAETQPLQKASKSNSTLNMATFKFKTPLEISSSESEDKGVKNVEERMSMKMNGLLRDSANDQNDQPLVSKKESCRRRAYKKPNFVLPDDLNHLIEFFQMLRKIHNLKPTTSCPEITFTYESEPDIRNIINAYNKHTASKVQQHSDMVVKNIVPLRTLQMKTHQSQMKSHHHHKRKSKQVHLSQTVINQSSAKRSRLTVQGFDIDVIPYSEENTKPQLLILEAPLNLDKQIKNLSVEPILKNKATDPSLDSQPRQSTIGYIKTPAISYSIPSTPTKMLPAEEQLHKTSPKSKPSCLLRHNRKHVKKQTRFLLPTEIDTNIKPITVDIPIPAEIVVSHPLVRKSDKFDSQSKPSVSPFLHELPIDFHTPLIQTVEVQTSSSLEDTEENDSNKSTESNVIPQMATVQTSCSIEEDDGAENNIEKSTQTDDPSVTQRIWEENKVVNVDKSTSYSPNLQSETRHAQQSTLDNYSDDPPPPLVEFSLECPTSKAKVIIQNTHLSAVSNACDDVQSIEKTPIQIVGVQTSSSEEDLEENDSKSTTPDDSEVVDKKSIQIVAVQTSLSIEDDDTDTFERSTQTDNPTVAQDTSEENEEPDVDKSTSCSMEFQLHVDEESKCKLLQLPPDPGNLEAFGQFKLSQATINTHYNVFEEQRNETFVPLKASRKTSKETDTAQSSRNDAVYEAAYHVFKSVLRPFSSSSSVLIVPVPKSEEHGSKQSKRVRSSDDPPPALKDLNLERSKPKAKLKKKRNMFEDHQSIEKNVSSASLVNRSTCLDHGREFPLNGKAEKVAWKESDTSKIAWDKKVEKLRKKSDVKYEISFVVDKTGSNRIINVVRKIDDDKNSTSLKDQSKSSVKHQSKSLAKDKTRSSVSDQSRSKVKQTGCLMKKKTKSLVRDQSKSSGKDKSKCLMKDKTRPSLKCSTRSLVEDQNISPVGMQKSCSKSVDDQKRFSVKVRLSSSANEQQTPSMAGQKRVVVKDQASSSTKNVRFKEKKERSAVKKEPCTCEPTQCSKRKGKIEAQRRKRERNNTEYSGQACPKHGNLKQNTSSCAHIYEEEIQDSILSKLVNLFKK